MAVEAPQVILVPRLHSFSTHSMCTTEFSTAHPLQWWEYIPERGTPENCGEGGEFKLTGREFGEGGRIRGRPASLQRPPPPGAEQQKGGRFRRTPPPPSRPRSPSRLPGGPAPPA